MLVGEQELIMSTGTPVEELSEALPEVVEPAPITASTEPGVFTKIGHFKRLLAASTAVLALSGLAGCGKDASGNSAPSSVEQSTGASFTPPADSTAPATKSPENSPSPTSIPSTTETSTTDTGGPNDEESIKAGDLGPTTPYAIAFKEGQKPTVNDVEVLVHNIEVAVNTGDLKNLLYSGIYPDSAIANGVSNDIERVKSEKQQLGNETVGSYKMEIGDNDVVFDPSDSGTVRVQVRTGTKFDFIYTSDSKPLVGYWEYTLKLANTTLTLPDGSSKNILSIDQIDVSPSNYQEWHSGYSTDSQQ